MILGNNMMECPIYIFTGPEIGERSAAVARIKSSLIKKYGTMDYHNLYVDSTPISKVLNILQTGSLFMGAVCIVLNGANNIKKKKNWNKLSSGHPQNKHSLQH